MIFISHRGNINGKNPQLENKPSYIQDALNNGYEVEIDIYYDNGWWLGHDNPQYKIAYNWLINSHKLWLHCKDINTLSKLSRRDGKNIWNDNLNYFWHQNDDYTLTNKKFIWTYPGKPLGRYNNSIAVLPETIPNWNIKNAVGICSDIIEKFKNE